jgi:hypothetical protein
MLDYMSLAEYVKRDRTEQKHSGRPEPRLVSKYC